MKKIIREILDEAYCDGQRNEHFGLQDKTDKILKLFKEARQKELKKIKGMKGSYNCYECGSKGYDEALSDIQKLLKE